MCSALTSHRGHIAPCAWWVMDKSNRLTLLAAQLCRQASLLSPSSEVPWGLQSPCQGVGALRRQTVGRPGQHKTLGPCHCVCDAGTLQGACCSPSLKCLSLSMPRAASLSGLHWPHLLPLLCRAPSITFVSYNVYTRPLHCHPSPVPGWWERGGRGD